MTSRAPAAHQHAPDSGQHTSDSGQHIPDPRQPEREAAQRLAMPVRAPAVFLKHTGLGRHRADGASPRAEGGPPARRALAGEIRVLRAVQVLSSLGEHTAQAAIAILVYAQTGSALLTATAYALAYLPPLAGDRILASLAARVPPRRLLIAADLTRAALVAAMALPDEPLYCVCTLLFACVLLRSSHASARNALLTEALARSGATLGYTVRNITFLATQIGGFLAAGGLAALVGPRPGIALDAATFACAAAVTTRGTRSLALPAAPPTAALLRHAARDGAAAVFGRPEIRALVLLGWVAGFAVAPEGLAAPYARSLGGGPALAGLLMSAMPIGMLAGAILMRRLTAAHTRLRLMGWLAMLSCAPLMLSVARPALWALAPLWILAGAGMTYQLSAASSFFRIVPAGETRANAFMVAQSGLLASQGLGILLAAAVADRATPAIAVSFAGLLGTTTAGLLAGCWARHYPALAAAAREPGPIRG